MKPKYITIIAVILSIAFAAPQAFADSPNKKKWEEQKKYEEKKREQRKKQDEQLREERKHRTEMNRENRKHKMEMEREQRKHWNEVASEREKWLVEMERERAKDMREMNERDRNHWDENQQQNWNRELDRRRADGDFRKYDDSNRLEWEVREFRDRKLRELGREGGDILFDEVSHLLRKI